MAHFRCNLCKETSTLSIFALFHECPMQAAPAPAAQILEFTPRPQAHLGPYTPVPPTPLEGT